MKTIFGLLTLSLSLNVFASGSVSFKEILEINEVEKLEETMTEKGYVLSTVTDDHAARGFFPRCICSQYTLTYSKRGGPSSLKRATKKFSVDTMGRGSMLSAKVTAVK